MSSPVISHVQNSINYAEVNTRSPMDHLGYIPIVGSISGTIRAVYGVAKAVFSTLMLLGSAIFTNQTHAWDESANDGLLHVGRGVVEFFSFIGAGLILNAYDNQREHHNNLRQQKNIRKTVINGLL